MQITFNLPHVFSGESSNDTENAETLRALLDLMVHLNVDYLETHPQTPSLYRSGVVYARTTWWEPIPALYARKKGDCKSLATARVAELLLAGVPAKVVFRFVRSSERGLLYHVLVQTPSGFEDPSKILGMGQHENAILI